MDISVNFFEVFKSFGTVFYYAWWAILVWPLWYIFDVMWFEYVAIYADNSYNSKYNWTMLEIIPPRDVERGPKPMEIFFTGLAGVIMTPNPFDEKIGGFFRQDPFSFELVGEEGRVHYYIRTVKSRRNMVEAQIYAQFPEAQILEVEDYYNKFPKIVPNRDWDLWGTDFDFVQKDPYYPIKTYDQFEESITGEMIDPMAALVEQLGTLGPGQHIWLQYMSTPIQEGESIKGGKALLDKLKGRTVSAPMGFLDHLLDIFSNLFAALSGPVEFKTVSAKKEEQPLDMRLSPVERETLKAVEENLGKNFFKTKMRMIYIGKRDGFDKAYCGAFIGAIKQFNDLNLNQVKPEAVSKTAGTIFFTKQRADFRKRKIYDRYRRRNMDGYNLILSTKELATMYHFPNITVKSPAISQTTSRLGVAPANLPIE
ncbi:MAG: hypothetical protein WAV31_02440 [Candidatus Moraniibacteriota bacterium]